MQRECANQEHELVQGYYRRWKLERTSIHTFNKTEHVLAYEYMQKDVYWIWTPLFHWQVHLGTSNIYINAIHVLRHPLQPNPNPSPIISAFQYQLKLMSDMRNNIRLPSFMRCPYCTMLRVPNIRACIDMSLPNVLHNTYLSHTFEISYTRTYNNIIWY